MPRLQPAHQQQTPSMHQISDRDSLICRHIICSNIICLYKRGRNYSFNRSKIVTETIIFIPIISRLISPFREKRIYHNPLRDSLRLTTVLPQDLPLRLVVLALRQLRIVETTPHFHVPTPIKTTALLTLTQTVTWVTHWRLPVSIYHLDFMKELPRGICQLVCLRPISASLRPPSMNILIKTITSCKFVILTLSFTKPTIILIIPIKFRSFKRV